MKSLRALLAALYSLLTGALRALRDDTPRTRPAHGPALPTRINKAALAFRAPRTSVGHAVDPTGPPTLRHVLRERAARPPLPPHLAAILASAPDVEPEFVRRPRITLASPLHRIAAKVRIYNPRLPAEAPVRATPTKESWAIRLQRAVGKIHGWLAFDTSPPQPG